jgi:hypothetical protein
MKQRTTFAASALLAGTILFGAFQAAQARSALRQADCPAQGNWCAESRGADDNCKICCGNPDSVCAFHSEDTGPAPLPQGCICA